MLRALGSSLTSSMYRYRVDNTGSTVIKVNRISAGNPNWIVSVAADAHVEVRQPIWKI